MTYAQYDTRTADLTSEFGLAKATEWFGQEAIDALPKFTRGKHAGKPKGVYEWTKVTRGGWVSDRYHPNGGYVENRSGSIIERKLCERNSSQYGVSAGKALHVLGQGETLEQRDTRKAASKIEYLVGAIASKDGDANEALRMIEKLTEALGIVDADKHDTIRSIIAEKREAIANAEAEIEERMRPELADLLSEHPAAIEVVRASLSAERAKTAEKLEASADSVTAEYEREDLAWYDTALGLLPATAAAQVA